MKTSGRGIFYIRTFMDSVSYSAGEGGGTVLTMTKDLANESEGEKMKRTRVTEDR